jgi:Flp pilus assembly pilin Flp
MKNLFNRFMREEEGQDLIEYALLVVFIAIVVAVVLPALGIRVAEIYTEITTALG